VEGSGRKATQVAAWAFENHNCTVGLLPDPETVGVNRGAGSNTEVAMERADDGRMVTVVM
jgi:hypothetical protein